MKNFVFLFLLASFLFGCEEDGPFIDFSPKAVPMQGDTAYIDSFSRTPQARNVFLEDITGVKCPNCPQAHKQAEDIYDANPGRIVIAALHAFSNPIFTDPSVPPGYGYPEFRDSTADYIVTQLLGNPSALPQGAVNRKFFPAEANRYIPYGKWSGYVNSELLIPTPMNLLITNSYNATTREVTSVVKMECTQDVTDTVYLSVGITENKIPGTQKSGSDTVQNYLHTHIFRKMLTPKAGLRLNSTTISLNSKQVIVRVYKYSLPAGWNVNNCNVIGILHKSSSRIDVMQCAEKKIL